jgi:hypothetical protein
MGQFNTAAPAVSANSFAALLARGVDAAAGALRAISRSRVATGAAIAVVIGGVFALGLQETGRGDTRVYDTEISRISASMGGRYVRVTGRLDTSKPYQTRLNLGPIELRGGEWVSLIGLDGPDRVWVTRATLPASASGDLTLVGRLTLGGGQEPPIYLEVTNPPDIAARDRLAALGGAAALAVVAGYLVTALARRADFAPRLPGFAAAALPTAPAFVWFGDVVPGSSDSGLRNAPVQIALLRREARISGEGWDTAVRRAYAVSPRTVATRYGALPGLQIFFEDERGLSRRAVLALPNATARDQLITALNYVGR